MNMKEAVTSAVFKKYATIEGRASRSEFWWFTLFLVLGGILFDVLDAVLGWQFGEPDIFGNRAGVLNLLFNLAVLVPIVCVTARRLHDVNRSGWWMLIPLTVIGIIPYIYWTVKKPEDNDEGRENQWGTNPLLDKA
jgi:uncharacterized membrane protein YhaH (DUF805 family)|tara:strand:- start:577 stop:984 length:408 start_codon:yes stop_codon:yes gene_type:complete